jgi:alcohol dehydrogenase class IV
MDHGIEALCSADGNPFVDAVVLRGIRLLSDYLPRAKGDPGDLETRRQCQFGSWLASFGLRARVPMGASHAIGHVLGGSCRVPHYLCTPVMMASVLKFNRPASEHAQILLAEALRKPAAPAADAFVEFVAELGLPQRLADVGVARSEFPLIARLSMQEIFIHTNPRPIRDADAVMEILDLAA